MTSTAKTGSSASPARKTKKNKATPETYAPVEYPVIANLGHIQPSATLLAEVLSPNFNFDDFCQGASIPADFAAFLQEEGYEVDEHTSRGMLFASMRGVSMHTDEKPIALWVLCAKSESPGHAAVELVCGVQSHELHAGEVLIFDARKRHGVIATVPGIWAVLSVYIRRIGEVQKDEVA